MYVLGAIQTIASLTTRPSRRQTLRDHIEWTAELATRTLESPHDLARFTSRLADVRDALESEPVLLGVDTGGKRSEGTPTHTTSISHWRGSSVSPRTIHKGNTMKIDSAEFRVKPDEKVTLRKWPCA